jgi:hypothetical protein
MLEKFKAEQTARSETKPIEVRTDKPAAERAEFVIPEIIQKVQACPAG